MGITAEEAKLTMVPRMQMAVDAKALKTVLNLIDALEENDDVSEVYSNIEITDEAMAELMAE
jgi:transcriptional/translational regulatory protein YebC/TACO1